MFSKKEKMMVAIEKILLELKHPEMPTEKPRFHLHVLGKEEWFYADIDPNWAFSGKIPEVNPWNEYARKLLAEREN